MQFWSGQYASWKAITPSDTTLITCRAIYIGSTGNLTVNPDKTAGTDVVFTAPVVGTIVPIQLNQGRVMAASTAGALIALS
jgi:hypothetical protein